MASFVASDAGSQREEVHDSDWVITQTHEPAAIPPTSTQRGMSVEAVVGRPLIGLAATTLPVVLSVAAPEVTSSARAPLRLVAVLDKSGSMRGEKLQLVLKTMSLMLRHLNERDALGLVQYDSSVSVLAPLTQCTAEGRALLDTVLQRVQAGTQTNLSGGLLRGIELHKEATRQSIDAMSSVIPLQRVRFGNTYRRLAQEDARERQPFGTGSPPPGAECVHEWTMQIRFENETDAALVRQVTYNLHESFTQAVVNVSEGPYFKLTRHGWGIFEVKAEMHLHDGRVLSLTHELAFGEPETFHTMLLPLRSETRADSGPASTYTAATQVDEGVVRSTFLFTDGLANQGITDTALLSAAAQAMLGELGDRRCVLSTFGFGKDHSAELLGTLAEVGQGTYSYISNEDEIGQAFGEALGGLLTTTHQNVRLVLELESGVRVATSCTDYPVEIGTCRESLNIDLGDLFAEERRDILVQLEVPESEAVSVTQIGRLSAQGFSVLGMASDTATPVELTVERGAEVGVDGDTPCVPHVERHHLRFLTTQALKEARAAADRGALESARRRLKDTADSLGNSPLAVQGDSAVLGFIADVNECLHDMRHREVYSQIGSKKMMNMQLAHGRQRAMNCETSEVYSNCHQKSMKAMFKSAVPSSLG